MGRRLLTLLAVFAIAWGGVAAATLSGLTPQLGLDLQGGISVILTLLFLVLSGLYIWYFPIWKKRRRQRAESAVRD